MFATKYDFHCADLKKIAANKKNSLHIFLPISIYVRRKITERLSKVYALRYSIIYSQIWTVGYAI